MAIVVESPQATAGAIEEYLRDNQLYYGLEPDPRGISSWTLATNNFEVTATQAGFLETELPRLIGLFHNLSAKLTEAALSGIQPLQTLRKALTVGVPEETISLWQQAIQTNKTLPFSTRPDIVIGPNGQMQIVEYNVDGGADKGNTEGVNHYAALYLGQPTLGRGLARLFVEGVRKKFPSQNYIHVTTVLPDGYRTEYEAQNRYFAARANHMGQQYGVNWKAINIGEIGASNGAVRVLDREFKLPGFLRNYDFTHERGLTLSALVGDFNMLGTVLPLSDKVLFSILFDLDLEPIIKEMVGERDLFKLRQVHAETQLVNPGHDSIVLNGTRLSWQEIADQKADFGMVLKRGGDSLGTTGSKGVVISTDQSRNPEYWKEAVYFALEAAGRGEEYWIIQKLHHSAFFNVRHLRDSAKQEKTTEAAVRFAPYYVQAREQFELGNVLVTAGVDREIRVKTPNNIHARRDNPYQAVTIKE